MFSESMYAVKVVDKSAEGMISIFAAVTGSIQPFTKFQILLKYFGAPMT